MEFHKLNTSQKTKMTNCIEVVLENYENDVKIGDLCNLHNMAFNEDYFITGYYEANKWLEQNNM